MKIRETQAIGSTSRYDAAAAESTLLELEAQFAAGEIERQAYFDKKKSLVRLFIKATTSPMKRRPNWESSDYTD